MMTRSEAIDFIKSHVKNKNLLNHMIATEIIMEALAPNFGGDPIVWGMAGLLHDIDYDTTANDPSTHSIVGSKMLEDAGLSEEICYAVKVHNDYHGLPMNTALDKALHVVDPLTGLIVASALIHPAKKLAVIDPEFVCKRFRESGFAKGAKREQIIKCESVLNMSLNELVTIGLGAMQRRASEIGL